MFLTPSTSTEHVQLRHSHQLPSTYLFNCVRPRLSASLTPALCRQRVLFLWSSNRWRLGLQHEEVHLRRLRGRIEQRKRESSLMPCPFLLAAMASVLFSKKALITSTCLVDDAQSSTKRCKPLTPSRVIRFAPLTKRYRYYICVILYIENQAERLRGVGDGLTSFSEFTIHNFGCVLRLQPSVRWCQISHDVR